MTRWCTFRLSPLRVLRERVDGQTASAGKPRHLSTPHCRVKIRGVVRWRGGPKSSIILKAITKSFEETMTSLNLRSSDVQGVESWKTTS